jgi:LPS sulfotransferase NodH
MLNVEERRARGIALPAPRARVGEAMGRRFDELNVKRTQAYAKDASGERFLELLNEDLRQREESLYRDHEIAHPFVFVVGLPRSGTTLLTQVLAYCLDAGYIDNFAARFWLAPVHGIRLSRLIAGEHGDAPFESDHARTATLTSIHEFGYFWRNRLNKHTFDDVVHAREREDEIDWVGLKRTLANVQHEFGRAFVAKNMLGAYHMPRLRDVLEMVVFVYIERDPLDVAVSILDARRKYFSDPSTWWSYIPVEYPLLEQRDYWEQIAGQVHYLTRFFDRALDEVGERNVVSVAYEQLCCDPASVLETVRARVATTYGYDLRIAQPPPESFPFRQRTGREADKQRFVELLERFRAEDP